jgi:DNA-directed RNA polymerase subunit M/transcription elongation factor TFIIS
MKIKTNCFKYCPSCSKILYYSSKDKLNRSIQWNSVCYSCSNKKRKISEETRKKLSTWERTPETRLKMALSHKNHSSYSKRIGCSIPKEIKNKISKSLYGRKLSDEHKNNISIQLKGRKQSETAITNSMIGREKSFYKRKPYKFGDKTIMIQGYENLTMDKLISDGLDYNKIKIYSNEKPRIKYQWNEKEHFYYPDCYIPENNLMVETKSDWTWKADLDRNIAKIKGTILNGYNIRLLIWDRHKKLIKDTIYNQINDPS